MSVWFDDFSQAEYTCDHYTDKETEHYQNLLS